MHRETRVRPTACPSSDTCQRTPTLVLSTISSTCPSVFIPTSRLFRACLHLPIVRHLIVLSPVVHRQRQGVIKCVPQLRPGSVVPCCMHRKMRLGLRHIHAGHLNAELVRHAAGRDLVPQPPHIYRKKHVLLLIIRRACPKPAYHILGGLHSAQRKAAVANTLGQHVSQQALPALIALMPRGAHKVVGKEGINEWVQDECIHLEQ
mmetsp:Transcript_24187/g.66201  ORF Transcript_24187/g.66201 Transcript_24187/m.66201 type:complete len:205 (+) Transcript_24187:531-1145(+)